MSCLWFQFQDRFSSSLIRQARFSVTHIKEPRYWFLCTNSPFSQAEASSTTPLLLLEFILIAPGKLEAVRVVDLLTRLSWISPLSGYSVLKALWANEATEDVCLVNTSVMVDSRLTNTKKFWLIALVGLCGYRVSSTCDKQLRAGARPRN